MVRGAPLPWFSGLVAGGAGVGVGSGVLSRSHSSPLSESPAISGFGLFGPRALKALLACGRGGAELTAPSD